MTLAEEAADYPAKVAAYLAKTGTRRLPWGTIVAGGHLTFKTTSAERAHRAELGEAAIRLLGELKFSIEELEEYAKQEPVCTPLTTTRSSAEPSAEPPVSP